MGIGLVYSFLTYDSLTQHLVKSSVCVIHRHHDYTPYPKMDLEIKWFSPASAVTYQQIFHGFKTTGTLPKLLSVLHYFYDLPDW